MFNLTNIIMKRTEIITYDLSNYKMLDYVDVKTGKHFYDENLFINENGEVISTKHVNMKKLKPIKTNGYITVMIGYGELMYIQRAVAHLFLSNPNNLLNIRFKDGNKMNCCLTNLEWR